VASEGARVTYDVHQAWRATSAYYERKGREVGRLLHEDQNAGGGDETDNERVWLHRNSNPECHNNEAPDPKGPSGVDVIAVF
jgi:hypothetical protein